MDAVDASIALLRVLKTKLKEENQSRLIVQHAYADFERIPDGALNSLFLIGIEPHHVVGTEQKNAADMKLCIDVMSTLYTRSDIKTFYLMAGDRDYIPVLRELEEHARTVNVVAFRRQTSGDLLKIIGEENYLDATELIESAIRVQMVEPTSHTPSTVPNRSNQKPTHALILPDYPSVDFKDEVKVQDQYMYAAINVLMKHFEGKQEVWVSPFLRRLRDELPELEDWERKELITDLVEVGAIKVEKRRGEPNDYSVIIVNWNHTDIRELVS